MHKLFTLATKRLLSSGGYRIARALKRPVKPLFINFPVTYRCNARCVMCDIWRKYDNNKYKETPADELTLAEIGDFVRRNRDFFSNLRSIGFTGGEPFLRNDMVDIIRTVHQELPGVDIGVQTNGLLPEMIREKLKKVLEFYPDFKIAVSLDGLDGIHDEVRGIKGAYEKALGTIEYAQELGITGITCGMTLTPRNFDSIREVAEKVEAWGGEFSCFLPENSQYFGNVNNKPRLTGEQLKIIAEELKAFSHHYFMDNLRLQIIGKTRRTLPCYSGYTSYVIDPYGEVFPCILRGERFGNIKERPFKEIINSAKAWELRKKIADCKCWCECEVSSSAVIAPFDVMRWFINNKNKRNILKSLNKKTLMGRL